MGHCPHLGGAQSEALKAYGGSDDDAPPNAALAYRTQNIADLRRHNIRFRKFFGLHDFRVVPPLSEALLPRQEAPRLIVMVAFDRGEGGEFQAAIGPADQTFQLAEVRQAGLVHDRLAVDDGHSPAACGRGEVRILVAPVDATAREGASLRPVALIFDPHHPSPSGGSSTSVGNWMNDARPTGRLGRMHKLPAQPDANKLN